MTDQNKRDKYAGTREWLRLEGIENPTEDSVREFTKTMHRRFSLFVALITVVLIALWFLFRHTI